MSLVGHSEPSASADPAISVDPTTGCWNWLRGRTDRGYGLLAIRRRSHYAHRVYYERHRGLIPEGLELDHLCRNRRCVNPAHLEAVTCAENIRRGRIAKLTHAQVREIAHRLDAGETPVRARPGIRGDSNCLDWGITWSEMTGRPKAPRRGKAPWISGNGPRRPSRSTCLRGPPCRPRRA